MPHMHELPKKGNILRFVKPVRHESTPHPAKLHWRPIDVPSCGHPSLDATESVLGTLLALGT